jgi:Asp-tRNA(Asn)/Glu-tRNA(Gln) amidotransferase A subunit family amidase
MVTLDGEPLGVSLLGPVGSDLALIRLAIDLHAACGGDVGLPSA